jgi:hypothetical protein
MCGLEGVECAYRVHPPLRGTRPPAVFDNILSPPPAQTNPA